MSVKPHIKSAAELLDWQEAIKAATGRQDVACVIGAWMAGLPSASMADRIVSDIAALNAENKPKGYVDWALSQAGKLFVYPIAIVASAAGNVAYGDKLYTIEDACPNGPSVSDALGILKDADKDLWIGATKTGELQRTAVAMQANQTARENLGKDLIDAAKYASTSLDSLTGGLVTVAKWGLVLWGLSKILSVWRK